MGISEFAVHNVLRTYSRQDRIGKAQRPRPEAARESRSLDQVTLSASAKKAQWISQLAGEMVDRQAPELSTEERSRVVRSTKDELLNRHGDQVKDDHVSPDALEKLLRPQYLG